MVKFFENVLFILYILFLLLPAIPLYPLPTIVAILSQQTLTGETVILKTKQKI